MYRCPKCLKYHEADTWDRRTERHYGCAPKGICSIKDNQRDLYLYVCNHCDALVSGTSIVEFNK